jgi:3-isopropylmalate/(R)-2-methylmalate dehydratase small subunit
VPTERIVAISGRGLPVRGDNIDTDRIIPARYLRSVSFEGLEEHLFADDRAQAQPSRADNDVARFGETSSARPHPIDDRRFTGASILVVNANFGCGSSREHAPQAIRRRGFRAVLGESFSEIFFGNAVALGMPCVSAARADVLRIMDTVDQNPELTLEVELNGLTVRFGDARANVTMPRAAREAFLDGSWDATGLLLDKFDEVEAVARRLPYLSGWSTRP